MLDDLNFTSIFNTIQGEGSNSGYYTTFIRLHTDQCFPNNRFCNFCDTIYRKTYNKNLKIHNIREFLLATKPPMITLTGGEPFAICFDDLTSFLEICKIYSPFIEVETNGSWFNNLDYCQIRKLNTLIDQYNISPKLKSSNVQYNYDLCFYNFDLIKNKSIFKFVISEKLFEKDIEEVKYFNRNLDLIDKIWLMPQTPCSNDFKKKLFDFCVKMKYNYSQRIHIDLFGHNFEKEV